MRRRHRRRRALPMLDGDHQPVAGPPARGRPLTGEPPDEPHPTGDAPPGAGRSRRRGDGVTALDGRPWTAPGPAGRHGSGRAQHTVVVRVTGTVDETNMASFTETVAAPFGTALHVVLDLRGVTTVSPAATRALLDLDRAATRGGTRLHVAGAPWQVTGQP